jgi:DNA replication protein DnaC
MDALKAGYLIRYTTLDDLIRELRQADRLGNLRQKLSQYQRPHLLICDEVGYLPLEPADANRFFQLINRRYTRSSTIVTSNKRVSEWGALLGDEIIAAAILDRLLHDAEVLTINGPSRRLRGRNEILNDEPPKETQATPDPSSAGGPRSRQTQPEPLKTTDTIR